MSKAKGWRSRSGSARCTVCKVSFVPNPRLGGRQKTCGKAECRRAAHAKYRRGYRKVNRDVEAEYQEKQRLSRQDGFWLRYREAHPESTERNRANSRLRKKLQKEGLQRQLDIVQLIDPIEKLDAVVRFATSHRSLLAECLPRKCG